MSIEARPRQASSPHAPSGCSRTGCSLREDNGRIAFIGPVRILIEADLEQAIVWLDRGLERARQEVTGRRCRAIWCFSCEAHLRRGELADAVLDGIEALEANRAVGSGARRGRCAPAFWLARRSRLVIWTARSGRSREVPPPGGEAPDRTGWHATFMSGRASLLLARGDPRGSLQLTLEAARRFEPRS